ncbi:MAG: IgGFc-binding protein, partial [Proteobacteria bacterium]|nr:IgGFc-binding protein [Pseudomonadota bacterium]
MTTDDPGPGAVNFTVEYFGITIMREARKGRTTIVNLPVGRAGDNGDIRISRENERNKGVHVKATDPTKLLTVYGINNADVSTDAFLALPCHRYPVTQYKYFVFSTSTMLTTDTFQSRFLIVPCEDTTSVTLRPTQQIQVNSDLDPDSISRQISAGREGTIRVNRLQTAQFNSNMDLTGTIIESDKPISVFVGHECGQVPTGKTACDHLVEQIPPDTTWGTQFFTVPLDVRESGERYRVGTVVNDNQVTVTC